MLYFSEFFIFYICFHGGGGEQKNNIITLLLCITNDVVSCTNDIKLQEQTRFAATWGEKEKPEVEVVISNYQKMICFL